MYLYIYTLSYSITVLPNYSPSVCADLRLSYCGITIESWRVGLNVYYTDADRAWEKLGRMTS